MLGVSLYATSRVMRAIANITCCFNWFLVHNCEIHIGREIRCENKESSHRKKATVFLAESNCKIFREFHEHKIVIFSFN